MSLSRQSGLLLAVLSLACVASQSTEVSADESKAAKLNPGIPTTIADSHLAGVDTDTVDWTAKTQAWWKETLPAQVYGVCRMAGTERPFTGDLLTEKRPGDFVCSSCGHTLFKADDKFKSGTGWPSYSDVAGKGAVKEITDTSHGMVRTEVRCGRCDAHLGHVFKDGPPPTGLRYCINSVCMLHVPDTGLGAATE